MIYKHQYFTLDENKKKVYDENDKELRLTGNAFRMLVFLCKNKSADATDIGAILDSAKDYTEDQLRQYKYKINTIIGYDVIEYRNKMYSLVGEVTETDKTEFKKRNTSLLRDGGIGLKEEIKRENTNIMAKAKKIKFSKIPAVIAAVFLLLTFLDWPYGFYTFMRFVVTGVAIYYAYYLYEAVKRLDFWFWGLVVIAVLFNPIIPIHLYNRTWWGIIDIVVVMFFAGLVIKINRPQS